jgi:2-aminoadipate transaminase
LKEQSNVRPADRWSETDIRDLLSPGALSIGAGTPTDTGVSWLLPTKVERPITLGAGVPDPATLPVGELQEVLARALADDPTGSLTYGGNLGFDGLREVLAQRQGRIDGVPLTLDNFIISNGSSGALNNICDALLKPGDVAIVEEPSFSGSIRTIRGHLADIVAVGMDDEGIRVDLLAATIEEAGRAGKQVKFVLTVADFHNPTGTTMSLDRRKALLELCANKQVLVVEDAAYAEIYFGEERPPSLYGLAEGQGVLKIGTFSKPIATGLRVGWVQGRADFIQALSQVRFDMGNSPLLLQALAEYVGSGELDRHLEQMRPLYRAKCDALCESLLENCGDHLSFRKPDGGFFVWVECRGVPAATLTAAAAEAGLAFPTGAMCYLGREKDDTSHIRLALSSAGLEDMKLVGPRMRDAVSRAMATATAPET